MSGDLLRLTVLGPMRAWRAGSELDLGPRQRRVVLALLLARSGEHVTTDEIISLLWTAPPAGAVNVVHQHIAAIRRTFEPGLPPRSAGCYLDRQGGSYRLRVDSDLAEFRSLVDQARQRAVQGRTAEALTVYGRALRLWHGRFAADLDAGTRTHPAVAAVDREHPALAREVAAAALSAAANGDDVGAVLEPLRAIAAENPYDEQLQAQLIRLLTAEGKRDDALAVHDAVSARLADDLDMAPGPQLRAAYETAVRQDQPRQEPSRSLATPAQLPADNRLFSGRDAELDALTALLPGATAPGQDVVTVVIDGIPGVGKSSLAVHWAHRVAPHFPDGQLFVNLRGYDAQGAFVDPDEALAGFLGALGAAQRDIPAGIEAKAALYRTMTTGRRILVVADNARNADQVRPLIPAAAGCMVVVTSRGRQPGLTVHDGAHPVSLEVPALDEARAQLRQRVGERRAAADPVALDRILHSCGRLPLALALVGARAVAHPGSPLHAIADDLRSAGETLDALHREDPERDVRAACAGQYRLLSSDAARLFRQLCLHPGPDIGLATIAGLAGTGTRQVARLVKELTSTRLLNEHGYRRYAFHDLTRAYAMELASIHDSPDEQRRALDRIREHLRLTAHAANEVLMPTLIPGTAPVPPSGVRSEPIPDTSAALSFFAAELPVLEALAQTLTDDPGTVRPWHVAGLLMAFYQRTGRYYNWSATARRAMAEAVAAGDELGEAHMGRMLGLAECYQGRPEQALAHQSRALALFEHHGRIAETGFVLYNMGWVEFTLGQADRAAAHYERALQLFTAVENRRGMALALIGLGYSHNQLKNHHKALRALDDSMVILKDIGDPNALASCADAKAEIHRSLGDYHASIAEAELSLRLARRSGNLVNQIEFLTGLGETLRLAGRPAEAVPALRTAISMADEAGLTMCAAEARARLARVQQ